jgi:sialate O-acetylesterase
MLLLLVTAQFSAQSSLDAILDVTSHDEMIYRVNRNTHPPPSMGISFNASYGSNMVLQQAPHRSCVSGVIGEGATGATLVLRNGAKTLASVSAEVLPSHSRNVTLWKACFPPQPATIGDAKITITATCRGCTLNTTSAVISDIMFGDVWYCGGQSNMALPLVHTLSRNISRDAIIAGKYSNIRIHGISGNMNPQQPWSTLQNALNDRLPSKGGQNDSDTSALMQFSSTCYYYGESLTDEMLKNSGQLTPIGLVHTAYGGSTIEQWLTNASISTCAQAAVSASNQEWHDERVVPYLGMTLKGWIWYQGENDMHNYFGNSIRHSGYGCLMKTLVSQWRHLWSSDHESGTDANAPFGFVTLAPSGAEGGSDIGTMRWAQTANYGHAPNPSLPNVFMAQTYDLNDPMHNDSCYSKTRCADNTPYNSSWPPSCRQYCASVKTTNWYMGPIHPRDKKPVGTRLAKAAMAVAYDKADSGYFANGPTISGCEVDSDQKSITVSFNASMMRSGGSAADKIKIQPYYDGASIVRGKAYTALGSKMEVLLNGSTFCMQAGGKSVTCRDDGTGRAFNFTTPPGAVTWTTVDIRVGAWNEVIVDISKVNGSIFGLRYAWTGDCCSENPPSADACPIQTCPIMGTASHLPAEPFIAKIVDNKCKCIAPQVCD